MTTLREVDENRMPSKDEKVILSTDGPSIQVGERNNVFLKIHLSDEVNGGVACDDSDDENEDPCESTSFQSSLSESTSTVERNGKESSVSGDNAERNSSKSTSSVERNGKESSVSGDNAERHSSKSTPSVARNGIESSVTGDNAERNSSKSTSIVERNGIESSVSGDNAERNSSKSTSSVERNGIESSVSGDNAERNSSKSTSSVERNGIESSVSSDNAERNSSKSTSSVERNGIESSETGDNAERNSTSSVERNGIESSESVDRCPRDNASPPLRVYQIGPSNNLVIDTRHFEETFCLPDNTEVKLITNIKAGKRKMKNSKTSLRVTIEDENAENAAFVIMHKKRTILDRFFEFFNLVVENISPGSIIIDIQPTSEHATTSLLQSVANGSLNEIIKQILKEEYVFKHIKGKRVTVNLELTIPEEVLEKEGRNILDSTELKLDKDSNITVTVKEQNVPIDEPKESTSVDAFYDSINQTDDVGDGNVVKTDNDAKIHVAKENEFGVNNDAPAPAAVIVGDGGDYDDDDDVGGDDERDTFKEDTTSSWDEPGNRAPVKSITLRPYQTELARTALDGVNTIVCAPTGSGKAYVSIKIMLEHLKKPGVRKIVFFANQVALVNQQFKVIKNFMPRDLRIQELTVDTKKALKEPFKELFSRNQILVMTPQILVDALRDGDVSMSEFTLLVFHECHHTHSRHPYNRIMSWYMDQKLDEYYKIVRKPLPQIVGLTASVGVGKARNIPGAVEHIQKLCANLDAGGGVSTVRDHEEDLAQHARTVRMVLKKTASRKEDIFKELVSGLVTDVERMIANAPITVRRMVGRPCFQRRGKGPIERGRNQDAITVPLDSHIRDHVRSCRRMIELYNTSLAINEDCRTKDAVLYLERELEKLYSSGVVMDDTDRELRDQFERIRFRLLDASNDPVCINPKLTSLAEMIKGAFSKQRESRCVILVRTRDLTIALRQWMLEDPNLVHLKPGLFTGHQVYSDWGGTDVYSLLHLPPRQFACDVAGTRWEQPVDAVDVYGDNHVIISVAEEGMVCRRDGQCNLVIMYQLVTNEIALASAAVTGRAPAKDSQFVMLAWNQKGAAEKEELNLTREMMMNTALVKLQEIDPKHFRSELLAIQKAAKAERDHEASNRKDDTSVMMSLKFAA